MRVAVVGAGGQVGRELLRRAPPDAELLPWTRSELDVTDAVAVADLLGSAGVDAVLNAAAYTAVDRAEEERETAFAVNAAGAGMLAGQAAARSARLLHLSTDFVFDGKRGAPYGPGDAPDPLGVYGRSKLEGERLVLAEHPRALVLRTAWLHSSRGGNFVRTVLDRMGKGEPLKVVFDQVGSPTWAGGLAEAAWRALSAGLSGIWHWVDAGVASWFDLAVAVGEEALRLGLLYETPRVLPVATAEFPTAARRPPFSVLDARATYAALELDPRHWREGLRRTLEELAASPGKGGEEG